MNPFEHYRDRLACYRRARERGFSDARFVALVRELDDAVGHLHGHGFRSTPFGAAPELADAVGVAADRLWLKDETDNVAGSHKARHLFGVLLDLMIAGDLRGELAIASCGNAALAAALLARAACRVLTVFIPAWADPAVVARLASLGARIRVCERRAGERGDPAYLRFTEAVAAGAVPFSCQATMTPTTIDGGRTLGFELADQMREHGMRGRCRVYVQVGGGALASALWMGLGEGIRDSGATLTPVLYPVQTTACAPLARAWDRLQEAAPDADARMAIARARPERFMWPWEEVRMSAASGILDDVTYDWLPIAAAMTTSGGRPVTCTEEEVVEAHRLVHAHTTIDADATGTSGLGGLLHEARRGRVTDDDHLVALITGVTRHAPRAGPKVSAARAGGAADRA